MSYDLTYLVECLGPHTSDEFSCKPRNHLELAWSDLEQSSQKAPRYSSQGIGSPEHFI